jgi:hypothetical protein
MVRGGRRVAPAGVLGTDGDHRTDPQPDRFTGAHTCPCRGAGANDGPCLGSDADSLAGDEHAGPDCDTDAFAAVLYARQHQPV